MAAIPLTISIDSSQLPASTSGRQIWIHGMPRKRNN